MKKTHIIIGSSAAGCGVLTKLRKLAPEDPIICITAQPELPYNTCLLADYMSTGTPPTTLMTKTDSFFTSNNISLHQNRRVEEIDTYKQEIRCHTGMRYQYDTLFIGTGTTPIIPPFQQPNAQNVFRFHTLNDTEKIVSHLATHRPKTVLVIGAGLSGVECADALAEQGLKVSLIEKNTHILPTLLDITASQVLTSIVQKHGVDVISQATVEHILVSNTGYATGAMLSNGITVPADMIVYALGARPTIAFAQSAGLVIRQGGIAVDHTLQTSIPHIYAGGDAATVPVALAPNEWARSCTWPDATAQGMHAARSMSGTPAEYNGVTIVLSSRFFGLRFVSCGPVVTPPAHYTLITQQGPEWYHRYLVHENKLKGFLLVGNLDHVGLLRSAVTSQNELTPELVAILKNQ